MNGDRGLGPTLEIYLKILKMQIKCKLDFNGTVYENGYYSYKANASKAKCSTSLFCQP